MKSFCEYLKTYSHKDFISHLACSSDKLIGDILAKESLSLKDFAVLLSPQAGKYLELMAQKAKVKTAQRFGHTIQMYAPLYISNECTNTCTYCSFTMENKIPRKTLNALELTAELEHLYQRGFRQILLVSGEHQKIITEEYVQECLKLCHKFSSVSIEFAPFSEEAYEGFVRHGANGLTIYQETYDREAYNTVHIRGKKKDFDWRLAGAERAAHANMRKINLGILLGLSENWQKDCINLAMHLNYMLKYYWQVKYTLSLPRICESETNFSSLGNINDKCFVQILLAFRLAFPDVGINLSTREPAHLRDGLIGLGVTDMSAESATDPGGYTLNDKALKQFKISDERQLEDIVAIIKEKNHDVIWKDWEAYLVG